MEKTILNLLDKYHGNWDDVYNAVSKKENTEHYKLNFNLPNELNYSFIAYKDYPDKFKDIIMPPFFVFWLGNIKLLDNYVLSFTDQLSDEDYQFLTSEAQVLNKYTLCFKVNDIDQNRIKNLVDKDYNIILISKGGLDNLHLSSELSTNKLLLISEFWDINQYQPSEGQTIERIIFAVADAIYLTTHSFSSLEKILFNYEHKKKMLFCLENLKEFITKFNFNNLKISYVKNIHDIV